MKADMPEQNAVLIADDHPVVREGMVTIVERYTDFHCIAQASGAREAVAKWREFKPQIGLFDLRMPDGDAVSAITHILEFDPKAKILVVSSFDADEEVYRVMKSGARGYMLKDSDPQDIASALKSIRSGLRYLPPQLASKLAERITHSELSQREKEILTMLAMGKRNAAIADELCISLATIKFHLNNIYSKLEVSSRTEAVSVAVKRGIIALN